MRDSFKLYVVLVVVALMLPAGAAFSDLIVDDDFDAYSSGDNYLTENTQGWVTWGGIPTVRTDNFVSSPNSLTGPDGDAANRGNYGMQKTLTGSDVIDSSNPADVTWSFKLRGANPYWTPVKVQIGVSGAQDRAYFSCGDNSSFYFKYLA
jgi:hypothetical protein